MVLLEALQHRYDTTLVTGAPFDCRRLNQAYHTDVDEGRITVRVAPMPKFVRNAVAGDALRGAFFGRFVKEIGEYYDVCISAYNFFDFGSPAIQFVADFSWDDDIRRAFDPNPPGLRGTFQRPGLMRRAYLALTDLIRSGHHEPDPRGEDIVVANSRWTADLLARRLGIDARVIYPPVYAPAARDQPRINDIVMLGRISPDKRILEAIEILAQVRQRGYDFSFHIIGQLDDSGYSNQVRAKAADCDHWVRLTGGLYGEAKFDFLSRHAFALHVRRREAFGIAVAEMVKMGLVPFVPADSAPAEIVCDARLTFQDADDAVETIDRMLRQPKQIGGVRRKLKERGALFSKERFTAEVQDLVEHAMNNRTRTPPRALSE